MRERTNSKETTSQCTLSMHKILLNKHEAECYAQAMMNETDRRTSPHTINGGDMTYQQIYSGAEGLIVNSYIHTIALTLTRKTPKHKDCPQNKGTILLRREQVKELISVLNEALLDTIKPS